MGKLRHSIPHLRFTELNWLERDSTWLVASPDRLSLALTSAASLLGLSPLQAKKLALLLAGGALAKKRITFFILGLFNTHSEP